MTTSTSEFDTKAFRRALGNFATGITVISATSATGEKVAITANSFNSVSLEPPLILWSLDKRSSTLEVFRNASHFAINVLAADQIDLSNHFAKPADDKFANIEHSEGLGRAPLLHDCAAVFECENYDIIEGGDHWIFLGKVVNFEDIGRAPLLYLQGSYSVALPHTRFPGASDSQDKGIAELEGKLQHNFYYMMTRAVRAYQADYQPQQLATGLRTSEARTLMVLEFDREMDTATLARETDMPKSEIVASAEILLRKGLIVEGDNGYRITEQGEERADELWRIANKQQDKVFSQFSDTELENFMKVLRAIS